MLPFGFLPTEELPGGPCSKVYATATHVLKVPFQGEELLSGFRAALVLESRGGPLIINHDATTGAVLMERISPGTSISASNLTEAQRIEVFARAVARFSDVLPDGYLPLGEYFEGDHPVLQHLLSTSPKPVFLHGDLHHGNLLQSADGRWVTIDPKGLAGDPSFEAAAWLRNPMDQLGESENINALTDARLSFLETTFGWDRWRMVAWCWVDLAIGNDGRHPNDPWTVLERTLRSRI